MKILFQFFIVSSLFFTFLACCDKEEPLSECEVKCAINPGDGDGEGDAAGKYFFDPKDKKCKLSRWTGSDTFTPFDTLEECESCGCKD